MKKYLHIFILSIFLISCTNQKPDFDARVNSSLPIQVETTLEIPSHSIENSDEESAQTEIKPQYPGVMIDQEFPILSIHDFQEKELKHKSYSINADDFQVTFKDFTPKSISKNGKVIFNLKTLYSEGYWSNLVGISRLLGENSKEIYVVANGTGGVCCTNYWITDVSGKTPRNIFRSEDFGSFRDAMEVFDADSDGVYELVQFDSAFRYFMGDCGSCSPEPRAVFKYDKKTGKYIPAKGIQQNFVKESFLKSEKWLAETYEKLKEEENPGLEIDFKRLLLAHIVDFFYLGEEDKAWKIFDKYFVDYSEKEKIRTEIKKRLRQSKFYRSLKNSF